MERTEVKQLSAKAVYKRLLVFVYPYRMRLIIGILCGMLYGAATFGMLMALRLALGGISGEDVSLTGITDLSGISDVTAPKGHVGELSVQRLLLTVSLLPIVTVLQGIIFFAGKYLVEWVGNRVVADLRARVFEHIHMLPIQFFSKSRVGELITRISGDTGLLNQLVSNVIGDVIREPFTLIGCIVAMVVMNWRLSVIALVVFPICIFPVLLLGKRVRKASKRGQETSADLLSVIQESINGALVVKAFQMEKEEVSRFNMFNRRVFKLQMKQSRSRSLTDPIVVFLSSIGLSGVVVYAYLNDISLALLVAFAGAMVQMYKPAKKLSQIHMRIQRAAPGAERVFEILDITNTIAD
ncbi:MAG TPA: ABC transporter transmembrane domain-containing protein, partial [Pontiella sp.]|nr:ABC transporter transmembrane domain-containing protein [Pontiella sp.]